MDNRDRDKVSREDAPTDAGEVNREVSRRNQDDSNVEFGENIGEAEEPVSNPRRPDRSEMNH